MRKVILHYHLFKNAGTSVDAAFKENVAPEEWVTAEFPGQPKANRERVAQWILDNPQAKVFSSHTAQLPPPNITGVEVFPVVFLRHPIARIASAYEFEARQGGDSFGAVLARNTNLSGYIETRLALMGDGQCRNFQVKRLANMFAHEGGNELARAQKALDVLPFVGLVEQFEKSMDRLGKLLQQEGWLKARLKPYRKNVSRQTRQPLNERLEEIKHSIGASLFRRLLEANNLDLKIHAAVVSLYQSGGDAARVSVPEQKVTSERVK